MYIRTTLISRVNLLTYILCIVRIMVAWFRNLYLIRLKVNSDKDSKRLLLSVEG